MSGIIDIEIHWLYMSKTLDIRSGEIDMNFHEKSNMAMLAIMIVVYGIYFGQALLSIVSAGVPPAEALAATNALMVVTVGAVTVLAIIAHIIIAVLAPSEADDARDERDKLMEMRGDQRGGVVMTIFALGALLIAMLDMPAYLIANTVLAGLVASEIVKGVSKMIGYRRGV
jgi:hypothetical protein